MSEFAHLPDLTDVPESLQQAIAETIRKELLWVRLGSRHWAWVIKDTNRPVMSVYLEYGSGDAFSYSWYTALDCDEYDLESTDLWDAEIEILQKAEETCLERLIRI